MTEINKSSNIQANFSLCSFNIRSMRKNLGSFNSYLDILHNFSVIGLTETWLKDEDCDLFNIPGYQMAEKHRTARNCGGVALCLKDGIEYNVCHDLIVFNEYMEWVNIEINKKIFDTEKDMIIWVIYRIPDTDIKEFNVQLSNILDKMCAQTKLVYLMGDYKINLMNSSTHEHTGEFVDILYSNEFLPLISRPTRITSNSAILIDDIMTNCLDNLNSSINGILVTDISDHFPVFHVNCSLTVEEFNTCSVKLVYSERYKQAFAEAISETN